jgi:predicted methyltransferase
MAKLGARARLARPCTLAAVAVAAVAVAAEPGLEARRIVEALRLGAGMVAADVGAGEGQFTGVLARRVGPSGRVYATEVAEDKLDEVKARMAADGIDNVSPCSATSSGRDSRRAAATASCCASSTTTSRTRRRCAAACGRRCGRAARSP